MRQLTTSTSGPGDDQLAATSALHSAVQGLVFSSMTSMLRQMVAAAPLSSQATSLADSSTQGRAHSSGLDRPNVLSSLTTVLNWAWAGDAAAAKRRAGT